MNEPAPKISNRQTANSDMNQLMNEILLHHKGDELLQRTSGFTKLRILADKAGIELLEWMKLYALSESPETVPITLPPAVNQDRIYAVEAMTAIMECYPMDSKKRQHHLIRNGYNSLIRFSFRARVPLIEWIISYYKTNYSIQPISEPSPPLPYKCPVPGCPEAFSTPEGLKGHGPNRCRVKYAKLALNAHES